MTGATAMEDVTVEFHTTRAIAPAQLRALYDSVGWWRERLVEEFAPLLTGGPAVGAWHDDHLVGFARAVSDGRFRAYVEDVVVRSEYRRSGIATRVLDLLLAELRAIDVVSLFCSDEHVPVYERSGFVRRGDIVMHRYRSDD